MNDVLQLLVCQSQRFFNSSYDLVLITHQRVSLSDGFCSE